MSTEFSGKTIIVGYGSTMSVEQLCTAKEHGWTILPEIPLTTGFIDCTGTISDAMLIELKTEVDEIFKDMRSKKPSDTDPVDVAAMNYIEGRK